MPGLPLGNATTDTQNDSQRFVCRLSRGRQRDGRSRETDEDDLCLSDLSVIYLSLFFFLSLYSFFSTRWWLSLFFFSPKALGLTETAPYLGNTYGTRREKNSFSNWWGEKTQSSSCDNRAKTYTIPPPPPTKLPRLLPTKYRRDRGMKVEEVWIYRSQRISLSPKTREKQVFLFFSYRLSRSQKKEKDCC
jgi:hypothetical protein